MTTIDHITSMAGYKNLAVAFLWSAIVDLRKRDRNGFRQQNKKTVHQANLDWLNEVPVPPPGKGEVRQFPLSLVAAIWGCETHWLRYRVALKTGLVVSGPSRLVSMPADERARQLLISQIVAQERAEALRAQFCEEE